MGSFMGGNGGTFGVRTGQEWDIQGRPINNLPVFCPLTLPSPPRSVAAERTVNRSSLIRLIWGRGGKRKAICRSPLSCLSKKGTDTLVTRRVPLVLDLLARSQLNCLCVGAAVCACEQYIHMYIFFKSRIGPPLWLGGCGGSGKRCVGGRGGKDRGGWRVARGERACATFSLPLLVAMGRRRAQVTCARSRAGD